MTVYSCRRKLCPTSSSSRSSSIDDDSRRDFPTSARSIKVRKRTVTRTSSIANRHSDEDNLAGKIPGRPQQILPPIRTCNEDDFSVLKLSEHEPSLLPARPPYSAKFPGMFFASVSNSQKFTSRVHSFHEKTRQPDDVFLRSFHPQKCTPTGTAPFLPAQRILLLPETSASKNYCPSVSSDVQSVRLSRSSCMMRVESL